MKRILFILIYSYLSISFAIGQSREIDVKFTFTKDSEKFQHYLQIIDSNSIYISELNPNTNQNTRIFYSPTDFDNLIEKLEFIDSIVNNSIDTSNKVDFEIIIDKNKKSYRFPFPNHQNALFCFLYGLANNSATDFPNQIIEKLQCKDIYQKWISDRNFKNGIFIYFNYGKDKYSSHNLLYSTNAMVVIDTNLLLEPLGSIFIEYSFSLNRSIDEWVFWEIPVSYNITSTTIKLLDSLISNDKLPYVTTCENKSKSKCLEILFFKDNRSNNYSRCINYDQNYHNIFEFCYLLESMKGPDFFWTTQTSSGIDWILENLADEEPLSNVEMNELYTQWKKENKP